MKTLTLNKSRGALIAIFLVSLALQLGISISDNRIGHDEFIEWLKLLLGVYSIHLGVMIGAIFARKANGSTRTAGFPFGLALCLTGSWNCLLIAYSLIFIWGREKFPDFLDTLTILSQDTSFLIAGVLAYFFGKPEK